MIRVVLAPLMRIFRHCSLLNSTLVQLRVLRHHSSNTLASLHLLSFEVSSSHEVLVVHPILPLSHAWILVLNLKVREGSSIAAVDHLLVKSLVSSFV